MLSESSSISRAVAVAVFALATLGAGAPGCASSGQTALVTTLGRDTVALESFTRTSTRVEGDLMVRVPGTVWFHYVAERNTDGTLARTMVETHAPGRPALADSRVTIELRGDSARLTVDSAGQRRIEMRAMPRDVEPIFMTGFDASYGLYNSIGMYELALARHPWTHPDTLTITALNPRTARISKRLFARRTPTAVDADFFRIAWTHLALDSAGNVLAADAMETTEKTISRRTSPLDVPRLAKEYARRDRAGTGVGLASPDTVVIATLAGSKVVISYGSPRRRGRAILGSVVPYDKVWRTGANAATVLMTDTPILLGETALPAGAYSLWTIPHRDGVDLVINRQHGQWGTDHDSAQDLARVAMHVDSVQAPREAFAITLDGADGGRTLRIAWDTFAWSVPVVAQGGAPRLAAPGHPALSKPIELHESADYRIMPPAGSDTTRGPLPLGPTQVTEAARVDGGESAILRVLSVPSRALVDSLLVRRRDLAPIWEHQHVRGLFIKVDYDGAHVRWFRQRTGQPAQQGDTTYGAPVFAFNELDLLVRALAASVGQPIIIPMVSEGTAELELDTLAMLAVPAGGDGASQVRFADSAVVSRYELAGAARKVVAHQVIMRDGGLRYVRRNRE